MCEEDHSRALIYRENSSILAMDTMRVKPETNRFDVASPVGMSIRTTGSLPYFKSVVG